MSEFLIKFKSRDSQYGVTRKTLKDLAAELGLTETTVIHIALSRFAQEMLPHYEMDEGPLSDRETERIRKIARAMMPKGELISSKSLL